MTAAYVGGDLSAEPTQLVDGRVGGHDAIRLVPWAARPDARDRHLVEQLRLSPAWPAVSRMAIGRPRPSAIGQRELGGRPAAEAAEGLASTARFSTQRFNPRSCNPVDARTAEPG